MAYGKRAAFEPLREIAFGSITGSYQAVGSAVSDNVRMIKITNGTNAPMYISLDGSTDHEKVPAAGYVLYDFSTNKIRDDGMFLPVGTVFYVKQDSAPSSGNLWIAVVYAQGGV